MDCIFCRKIWNNIKEYKEYYRENEYYEEDAIVMFNGKHWLYVTCEDSYYNDTNMQINYCPKCGRKLVN